MSGHLECEDRHRQHEADPEPPRHVEERRVGLVLRRRQHGLERHPTFGTGARTHLANLRMHRAGVDRPFWRFPRGRGAMFRMTGRMASTLRRRVPGVLVGVASRVSLELRLARPRAEEELLAEIAFAASGLVRVYPHPANGIRDLRGGLRRVAIDRSTSVHVRSHTRNRLPARPKVTREVTWFMISFESARSDALRYPGVAHFHAGNGIARGLSGSSGVNTITRRYRASCPRTPPCLFRPSHSAFSGCRARIRG